MSFIKTSMKATMNFCQHCGSNQISWEIPKGDHKPRHICLKCEVIFYENPRIIAGCLATHKGKILLCKRAIEPRRGYWTLPAGFLENGETIQQGAERETWEEAEARVKPEGLYTIFNLIHINQVYMFYRGQLIDGQYGAGCETLEAKLFSPDEIPWEDLAFPTIYQTLKFFIGDLKTGQFPQRIETIDRNPQKPR